MATVTGRPVSIISSDGEFMEAEGSFVRGETEPSTGRESTRSTKSLSIFKNPDASLTMPRSEEMTYNMYNQEIITDAGTSSSNSTLKKKKKKVPLPLPDARRSSTDSGQKNGATVATEHTQPLYTKKQGSFQIKAGSAFENNNEVMVSPTSQDSEFKNTLEYTLTRRQKPSDSSLNRDASTSASVVTEKITNQTTSMSSSTRTFTGTSTKPDSSVSRATENSAQETYEASRGQTGDKVDTATGNGSTTATVLTAVRYKKFVNGEEATPSQQQTSKTSLAMKESIGAAPVIPPKPKDYYSESGGSASSSRAGTLSRQKDYQSGASTPTREAHELVTEGTVGRLAKQLSEKIPISGTQSQASSTHSTLDRKSTKTVSQISVSSSVKQDESPKQMLTESVQSDTESRDRQKASASNGTPASPRRAMSPELTAELKKRATEFEAKAIIRQASSDLDRLSSPVARASSTDSNIDDVLKHNAQYMSDDGTEQRFKVGHTRSNDSTDYTSRVEITERETRSDRDETPTPTGYTNDAAVVSATSKSGRDNRNHTGVSRRAPYSPPEGPLSSSVQSSVSNSFNSEYNRDSPEGPEVHAAGRRAAPGGREKMKRMDQPLTVDVVPPYTTTTSSETTPSERYQPLTWNRRSIGAESDSTLTGDDDHRYSGRSRIYHGREKMRRERSLEDTDTDRPVRLEARSYDRGYSGESTRGYRLQDRSFEYDGPDSSPTISSPERNQRYGSKERIFDQENNQRRGSKERIFDEPTDQKYGSRERMYEDQPNNQEYGSKEGLFDHQNNNRYDSKKIIYDPQSDLDGEEGRYSAQPDVDKRRGNNERLFEQNVAMDQQLRYPDPSDTNRRYGSRERVFDQTSDIEFQERKLRTPTVEAPRRYGSRERIFDESSDSKDHDRPLERSERDQRYFNTQASYDRDSDTSEPPLIQKRTYSSKSTHRESFDNDDGYEVPIDLRQSDRKRSLPTSQRSYHSRVIERKRDPELDQLSGRIISGDREDPTLNNSYSLPADNYNRDDYDRDYRTRDTSAIYTEVARPRNERDVAAEISNVTYKKDGGTTTRRHVSKFQVSEDDGGSVYSDQEFITRGKSVQSPRGIPSAFTITQNTSERPTVAGVITVDERQHNRSFNSLFDDNTSERGQSVAGILRVTSPRATPAFAPNNFQPINGYLRVSSPPPPPMFAVNQRGGPLDGSYADLTRVQSPFSPQGYSQGYGYDGNDMGLDSTMEIMSPDLSYEVGAIDPELRDAKKAGNNYHISMNLKPQLFATRAPSRNMFSPTMQQPIMRTTSMQSAYYEPSNYPGNYPDNYPGGYPEDEGQFIQTLNVTGFQQPPPQPQVQTYRVATNMPPQSFHAVNSFSATPTPSVRSNGRRTPAFIADNDVGFNLELVNLPTQLSTGQSFKSDVVSNDRYVIAQVDQTMADRPGSNASRFVLGSVSETRPAEPQKKAVRSDSRFVLGGITETRPTENSKQTVRNNYQITKTVESRGPVVENSRDSTNSRSGRYFTETNEVEYNKENISRGTTSRIRPEPNGRDSRRDKSPRKKYFDDIDAEKPQTPSKRTATSSVPPKSRSRSTDRSLDGDTQQVRKTSLNTIYTSPMEVRGPSPAASKDEGRYTGSVKSSNYDTRLSPHADRKETPDPLKDRGNRSIDELSERSYKYENDSYRKSPSAVGESSITTKYTKTSTYYNEGDKDTDRDSVGHRSDLERSPPRGIYSDVDDDVTNRRRHDDSFQYSDQPSPHQLKERGTDELSERSYKYESDRRSPEDLVTTTHTKSSVYYNERDTDRDSISYSDTGSKTWRSPADGRYNHDSSPPVGRADQSDRDYLNDSGYDINPLNIDETLLKSRVNGSLAINAEDYGGGFERRREEERDSHVDGFSGAPAQQSSYPDDDDFDTEIKVHRGYDGLSRKKEELDTGILRTSSPTRRRQHDQTTIRDLRRLDIASLYVGAPAHSVKQTIDVERLDDEILYSLPPGHRPRARRLSSAGETGTTSPLEEYDKVDEHVDMDVKDGKAVMICKVRSEKIVPISGSEDMFKKSSVILTRRVEVNLLATPMRQSLYETIVQRQRESGVYEDLETWRDASRESDGLPGLSKEENDELYRVFMGLAEMDKSIPA